MDFFENAHVTKKQPLKKESKSEENMKKQLKQMLYGYKNSDNELIKSSAYVNNDLNQARRGLDDSTSVSGFSDLSLTISDNEADNSQDTTSKSTENIVLNDSQENISNISDDEKDLSENRQGTNSSLKGIVEDFVDSAREDHESLSECNEDIVSLSEDIDLGESVTSSDDISLIEALEDTSTECSNDSDLEFDPDGSLAVKILEKLGKKDFIKKGKKRKIEEIMKKDKAKKDKVKSVDKQVIAGCGADLKNLSLHKDIDTECKTSDSQDSQSTNRSSPYISISASQMPDQSLNELLGDYVHPTVKNLPSEKQNVVYSTNNSGLFSTDEIGMQVEDVDSLIPELGDEVEDLDLDEDSNIPVDESTTAYDTIPSDSEIESTDEDFVSPVTVFYGNDCCVFVLKHPTELFVNGKVKIKPLGGTVEIFGYTLKHEVKLYAPNYNYAHCVKTVENQNAYYGLFGKLTSVGLTVAEAEEIVTTLGEYDGVISMSMLTDCRMDFVDNYFAVADLFTKPNRNTDSYLRKASLRLNCSLYLTRPWRFFEENECWSEAITCGSIEQSRGIVCGGKGLGKSTFLRYYVNKMLENGPVLVIDLDPGQAEFTVAGNISATVVTQPLLGPNFTHLKKPDIMLNIGMINTMDNIVRYATAVTDLITHCRSNPAYRDLPWIINTMGMCNNTGLKLVTLAILFAQPTFLVQIDSKVAKKRFDCHLQPHNVTQLYFKEFKYDRLFRNVQAPELEYTFVLTRHVEGSERQNTSMSPKDERYLNYLAYFGELLNLHSDKDLLGIVPYEVNLSDLNVVTNVKVAPEAVTKVLNGKIVALCQLAALDKGKVFNLGDKPLLCHGQGLVRGVDFEKGVAYIITPVGAERLAAVDALLYADWTPELVGVGCGPAGAPVPYRASSAHQHRQFMHTPRRRFNPLQLLKMSRRA